MNITVRIIGIETLADRSKHTLTLPENTTLQEALAIIVDKLQLKADAGQLAKSSFLVNNRRVYPNYTLLNGDYLQILRTLEGG